MPVPVMRRVPLSRRACAEWSSVLAWRDRGFLGGRRTDPVMKNTAANTARRDAASTHALVDVGFVVFEHRLRTVDCRARGTCDDPVLTSTALLYTATTAVVAHARKPRGDETPLRNLERGMLTQIVRVPQIKPRFSSPTRT